MELQTSFIPKKTFGVNSPVRAGKRPVGLVLLVSLLVFVSAVLTHGGVLLWQAGLRNAIKSKRDMLQRAQKDFDQPLLDALTRMDAKIGAIEGVHDAGRGVDQPGLLDEHLTLLPFLTYLEQNTLSNVRFRSLKYARSDNGNVTLAMNGLAQDYSAVAVQSEQFSGLTGNPVYFRNMVFSNLNLDPTGAVSFDFSASVDPQLFSYRELAKQKVGL